MVTNRKPSVFLVPKQVLEPHLESNSKDHFAALNGPNNLTYSDHSERSEDVVLNGGVNGQEHCTGMSRIDGLCYGGECYDDGVAKKINLNIKNKTIISSHPALSSLHLSCP